MIRFPVIVPYAIAMAILLASGCAPARSSSPYMHIRESERNPSLADRLNLEAAAIIDSDPERAEGLLRDALAADLYHGPAHNNLGTLLLAKGELFSASEEFQWASRLLPGHPDPRMNLAFTLELAGRTDDALTTYLTALEVYPEHIPTMQALTRLQIRSRRPDDDTTQRLADISLRGDHPAWREWARRRLSLLPSIP